jgi:hypothetical protein
MAVEVAPQKRQDQQPAPPSGRRAAALDAIWRLGAWGVAAALSVAAVTVIVRTDSGSERLQSLLNGTAEATTPATITPMPSRAVELDAATRALDAQVRELSADRDRLAARLASLERHMDDMTGSIQPTVHSALAAMPAPSASLPAVTLAPAPHPPKIAAPPLHIIDPLAAAPGREGAASWPETHKPPEVSGDASNLAPLPPARMVASLPNPPETAQATAAETTTAPAASRIEYGIELATGPTVDALRAHWAAVKANFGPLLTGLEPVAVRERRAGVTGYRLVAGPMPSFTAAKQVCVRFTQAHMACHPAKFDGQAIVQR